MNYYEEIKKELVNNEIYKRVKDYSKNKSDLSTYYNVGKLLVEAQGGLDRNEYGNNLIKKYALKLTKELGKGYSWRSLYNMRLFYGRIRRGRLRNVVSVPPDRQKHRYFNKIRERQALSFFRKFV